MLTNSEVGEAIRSVRRRAGLSQSQLAILLTPPRSHAAVSDIERGRTAITVDLLAQLAAALNTEVAALLGLATTWTPEDERDYQQLAAKRARCLGSPDAGATPVGEG